MFISFIKKKMTNLPYFIGKIISLLPFGQRPLIGKIYSSRKKEIDNFNKLNLSNRENYIFERMNKIVNHAYEKVDFYRDHYDENNFHPSHLKNFDDIKLIPTISKNLLQSIPLEKRIDNRVSGYLENTGGSSGKPLEFMIQPNSVGHEWAHMHEIWSNLGYRYSDLRIVFSGRSENDQPIFYDSSRHQYNVNIYSGWHKVVEKMQKIFPKQMPKYLHGYPSAIFDFILWLHDTRHPYLKNLKSVEGIFLGSEFPDFSKRKKVEKILSCKTISWYGHTERTILAYEKYKNYEYVPFQTYGYTESIECDNDQYLVGTSYYNFLHPMIRYNSDDIIKPIYDDSLLTSFSVSKGRKGDFILDSDKNKIFLTGLIFGRHHAIFNFCTSLQIRQISAGLAEVLYVERSGCTISDPQDLFDSKNVNIEFSFRKLDQPLKTISGKVPLLVVDI